MNSLSDFQLDVSALGLDDLRAQPVGKQPGLWPVRDPVPGSDHPENQVAILALVFLARASAMRQRCHQQRSIDEGDCPGRMCAFRLDVERIRDQFG